VADDQERARERDRNGVGVGGNRGREARGRYEPLGGSADPLGSEREGDPLVGSGGIVAAAAAAREEGSRQSEDGEKRGDRTAWIELHGFSYPTMRVSPDPIPLREMCHYSTRRLALAGLNLSVRYSLEDRMNPRPSTRWPL